MGILSFLNKSRNQEQDIEDFKEFDDTPSISQAAGKPKVELPDLRREMPIEILGEDGQVMIDRLITECSRREIAIGRRLGGFSFEICEIGSGVVIQGCDSRLAKFCLRAVVAESSRIHLRLKDLVQEVRDDLRDAFRLAVNTPITVFYYDDEHMQLPMDCTLVDISTGGCCISSEQAYEDGEVLRLRIKLGDYVPMNLVGEIIRVTECGYKDYSYGILFAQIDIAMVNKYYDLASMQTEVPAATHAHYEALEHHADKCVGCRGCESRCPFGVKIAQRMEQTAKLFRRT